VRKWLKGEPANIDQANALADYEQLTAPEDRRDFIAFTRTGKLERSNPSHLVESLLSGQLPLPDFVRQLRHEEGMSPEQFDAEVGLGKGATRNMEAGRELRTEGAARFTEYMKPKILPLLLEQFNERLLAPNRVPLEKRVKPQEWLRRIRSEGFTFTDYLRTKLLESGMSKLQFAEHLSTASGSVSASALNSWLHGSHALAIHAGLIADVEGLKETDDRRDFIAFVRTGILQRADPKQLVDKLSQGQMSVADFVHQLRTQEGMNREQFDAMCGMQVGTTHRIESGHAPDAASADKIVPKVIGLSPADRAILRAHLCKESSVAPSSQGFDPEGYRELMDRAQESCGMMSLEHLRIITASVRFDHGDPQEESCWRAIAADSMAKKSAAALEQTPNDFNAVYDVLFTKVHPDLLRDGLFRKRVEAVMLELGQRQDGGVARRWMTGLIARKMHEDIPEAQREFLIENSALLNMRFISGITQHHLGAKSMVDETMPTVGGDPGGT
jgi:DNA-binding transcriptional regulator YiaG